MSPRPRGVRWLGGASWINLLGLPVSSFWEQRVFGKQLKPANCANTNRARALERVPSNVHLRVKRRDMRLIIAIWAKASLEAAVFS